MDPEELQGDETVYPSLGGFETEDGLKGVDAEE
jgi:hypothetical protein